MLPLQCLVDHRADNTGLLPGDALVAIGLALGRRTRLRDPGQQHFGQGRICRYGKDYSGQRSSFALCGPIKDALVI